MPSYNAEAFIAESIESVLRQTYTNWELVIVDDASDDGTCDIIKRFSAQDDRIQFEIKPQHSGIADTRNQCIRLAKGRFLAFLDSDDIWLPEKLEHQLQFMASRGIGLSYSTYECIDETGNRLNKTIKAEDDLDYEAYLRNTIIGCSTVMLDKTVVGDVEVPRFRTSEDTATWLQILKKGFKAYAIEPTLVLYRIRRKSASSNKLKASADLWKVYRQQENLSLCKAIECFLSYAFHAIKKRLR